MNSNRQSKPSRTVAFLPRLAGIEYGGIAGCSLECRDAVLRYIQCDDLPTLVTILSCGHDHALILNAASGDQVAIKTGFASGYVGLGSVSFSYVLAALYAVNVEIEEVRVTSHLLRRLDSSALLSSDLKFIGNAERTTGLAWWDYVLERHEPDFSARKLNPRELPLVIPYSLIDKRLIELAVTFWSNPDHALSTAYKRLEDVVRSRTGLTLSGTKLFSSAFDPQNGILRWNQVDRSETSGRMSLFTGAYGAHRNPRAHRELKLSALDLLSEFLVINHLFRLECDAIEVSVKQ